MAKEVKAPKKVVTPKEEAPVEEKGESLIVPAAARIVFGGPVIGKVTYPFGFTVDTKLTEDEMKEYGVGNGVTYHCNAGLGEDIKHTYKIVYSV